MEEKLIEFMRQNDIFYNKNNTQYKNLYLRDKKLEELSRQLNVPVKKLKFRWRSLKDKFFREWKEKNNPSRIHQRTSKKKWKWMDKMIFLSDVAPGNNSKISCKSEELDSDPYPNCADELSSTTSTFETVYLADDVHSSREEPTPQSAAPKRQRKTENEDSIEKQILESRNEMCDLIALAKEALLEPKEKQKTVVETFFEMLATQTTEANLTSREFSMLQMELLKCFHKFLHKC